MRTGLDGHGAVGMRDYLHVVRRQGWVIALALVLVPAVAVLLSRREAPSYQASAQVLLSGQDLANALTGVQTPTGSAPDSTLVATQAQLAHVPEVARRALAQLGLRSVTPEQFLADCSVTSSATTDILGFTCRSRYPDDAKQMVNAYARQYTTYRRRLDTDALESARRQVAAKIHQLVRQKKERGSLYGTLIEREQELQTMEELQTANATVVELAAQAGRIGPRTMRNGILGLILGVALGLGLAFLREVLDTRVRSAAEIGERLGGLPLLARIPMPSRALRAKNKLVMLELPKGTHAEAFRMLRTNLGFANLDRQARAIMVTSAVELEGKSTTIANLAVAMARSGRRVILVDLDLRRPFLHRLFGLQGPGITEVALGRASLDEALAPVAIADTLKRRKRPLARSNGHAPEPRPIRGTLQVLPCGTVPPDPGEFIGTATLSEILDALRRRADIVLIDAPPALHVGDAMTLSTKVDGILVISRMKVVRRPMLDELGRQLATTPTPVLGFVLTDAAAEDAYGYRPNAYFADDYDYPRAAARPRQPLA